MGVTGDLFVYISLCPDSWKLAFQLLDCRSDFTGHKKLKYAGSVHLAAVKIRGLRGSLNIWTFPPGLSSIQTSQEHMVSYLYALLRDYCVFDLAHYLL